jgi:hypothetical protein
MNHLTHLVSYISELTEITPNTANKDMIDVKHLTECKKKLEIMKYLHKTLGHLNEIIIESINRECKQLETDTSEVLAVYKSIKEYEYDPDEDTWSQMSFKDKYIKSTDHINLVRGIHYIQPVLIPISATMSISATIVPHMGHIQNDGRLYYVKANKQFALKIAHILLYGRIGVVYNNVKKPTRIKKCVYGKRCNNVRKCNYYHDPLTYEKSTDTRNFIANSWLTIEETSKRSNEPNRRRFGSLDRLDIDIICMNEDDIGLFKAQLFHDILCCYILENYAK